MLDPYHQERSLEIESGIAKKNLNRCRQRRPGSHEDGNGVIEKRKEAICGVVDVDWIEKQRGRAVAGESMKAVGRAV